MLSAHIKESILNEREPRAIKTMIKFQHRNIPMQHMFSFHKKASNNDFFKIHLWIGSVRSWEKLNKMYIREMVINVTQKKSEIRTSE